jgi:hypothetical protein
MTSALRTQAALVLSTIALTSPGFAQIRMSEAATVSQTVDGTVITVAYSRPQLRGRPVGSDGVIHIEHMWTPGANWATTLEASRPITLNGHQVAAGKYSLWLETTERDWTVHLNPEPRLFHTFAPKPATMLLSFQVTPEHAAEPVEVLSFDFPEVRQDGATLRLRWAKVVVPFKIGVEPSRKVVAMTEQQAAPYVGSWTVQMYDELNRKSPEMKMEILLANGALKGVIDGPMPFGMEFIPQPDGKTWFLGFVMNGKLMDVEQNAPVEFELKDGRAVRMFGRPVKGMSDESWIWASRRP